MNESSLYKKLFLALQEISYIVINRNKSTSIANALLDVAIDFTSAEAGSLMLLNERNDLFILSSRGLPDDYVKNYRGKIGEGIAGMVAKTRRPLFVKDIKEHPELAVNQRDHYKTRSFISCPIIYKERLLGIINIHDKKDGKLFTTDELGLLQIIANHAAIAFENSLLFAQLKSSAIELEHMNQKLVESDLVKTDFLTRISHELRTPLNSLSGAIYFLQQHENVPLADQKEFYSIISAEATKLAGTVENLLKFLQFEDESRVIDKTAINISAILRELLHAAALKAFLKGRQLTVKLGPLPTPLATVGDSIRIGQLFSNLLECVGHHLSPGDVIAINAKENDDIVVEITLPRELPVALLHQLNSSRNISSRMPSDDRLKLYLSKNVVFAHRGTMVAQNSSGACVIAVTIPKKRKEALNAMVSQNLDVIVNHVSDALKLDICSVMLADELTGELQVRSAQGLDEDIVKRTRIKFGDKIAGWVALEGKPLFIEDLENDSRFSMLINNAQYKTKSLISIPLKIDNRVVGVLNLNNKKSSEPFTAQEYQVALSLSEKISGYLQRMRTDRFQDDEFQQFLSSIDTLIRDRTA